MNIEVSLRMSSLRDFHVEPSHVILSAFIMTRLLYCGEALFATVIMTVLGSGTTQEAIRNLQQLD